MEEFEVPEGWVYMRKPANDGGWVRVLCAPDQIAKYEERGFTRAPNVGHARVSDETGPTFGCLVMGLIALIAAPLILYIARHAWGVFVEVAGQISRNLGHY